MSSSAFAMPPFIKALFNAFPLVSLPPLHPFTETSKRQHDSNLESTSKFDGDEDDDDDDEKDILYVLPRHPRSLSVQLQYRHVARHSSSGVTRTRTRVRTRYCSSRLASGHHPFLYEAGTHQILYGHVLDSHLRAGIITTAKEEESIARGGKNEEERESLAAFESLIAVLEDTYFLATSADGMAAQSAAPWRVWASILLGTSRGQIASLSMTEEEKKRFERLLRREGSSLSSSSSPSSSWWSALFAVDRGGSSNGGTAAGRSGWEKRLFAFEEALAALDVFLQSCPRPGDPGTAQGKERGGSRKLTLGEERLSDACVAYVHVLTTGKPSSPGPEGGSDDGGSMTVVRPNRVGPRETELRRVVEKFPGLLRRRDTVMREFGDKLLL